MEILKKIYSRIDLVLIFIAMAIGFCSLFIPIWYMVAGILLLIVFLLGLKYPKYLFYALIFTIPFTERVRILPISFSINDIFLLWCTVGVIVDINLRRVPVEFNTKINNWIIILLILFSWSGFTSIGETGYLSVFKFVEAIFVFYFAVYFIRTKQITRSKILKVVIAAVLFQSLLGILQSVTGSLGAGFQSNRGYLGYLGLGSNHVWHACGTMKYNAFNSFGNYLITNFLFLLPFGFFLIKNKSKNILMLTIMLLGIVMSYSRGSLLGLVFGVLYFTYMAQKNKKRGLLLALTYIVVVAIISMLLAKTNYIHTVDLQGRLDIWQAPIASITSSWKNLWLGSGLNSYFAAVSMYFPGNLMPSQYPQHFAHNYYLLVVQEMGILGFVVLFSFFIYLLVNLTRSFKQNHGLMKIISMSICLCIISMFFVSIFDHSYGTTYFKEMFFLFLGLYYAQIDTQYKKV